jgi:hypothetical protein
MGTRERKTRTPPEILSGWKSIARHLGMGVRTVQRYERQMGLPIRRPAGKMRGAVLATKSELDAWIAASPIRESFHLANLSPAFPSQDMDAIERGVAEMRILRDHMVALRSEVRESMQSLRDGIRTLRGDLRPGHWEIPFLSTLDSNPQTRRLLEWMSIETKDRKGN